MAEEEQQDQQQQIAQQAKAQKEQAKKQELKNKLNKIYYSHRLIPILTPMERITLAKGKKEFPDMVLKIEEKFSVLKTKKGSNALSTGSPALAIIYKILLFLSIALLICILIDSILGAVSDGANAGKKGSEGGTSSDTLYCVRTIYADEEKAQEYMLNSYAGQIATSVSNSALSGEDFTVKLTLPANDFNYTKLLTAYEDNTDENYHLAQLTYIYAKAVYDADVATGLATAGETEFANVLNATNYFGISQASVESAATSLTSYITTNNLVVANDTDSGAHTSNLENIIKTSLEANVGVRAEKYFIEDLEVEEGEHAPSLSTKRNYIAYIYMNNKDVRVSGLSYLMDEKITVKIYNDNTSIEMSEPEPMMDDSPNYGIENKNSNLSETVAKTTKYFEEDKSLLENGASLLDLAEKADRYLKETENSTNELKIYTYSTYGFRAEFENPENLKFTFSEFMTTVE